MCHVQPLSRTKVTPLSPVPRACALARRLARPAIRARPRIDGPGTVTGLEARECGCAGSARARGDVWRGARLHVLEIKTANSRTGSRQVQTNSSRQTWMCASHEYASAAVVRR
eukprot:849077-Pleurochrysis_carterae.AAC.2